MGMRAAFFAVRSSSIRRSTQVRFSTNVLSSPATLDEKWMPPSLTEATLNPKKLKAISRVSEIGPTGKLPPQTLYLIEIGIQLDKIKKMAQRFPEFSSCNLEGKIRPTVEFLLDLGVPKLNIPSILFRNPQLCGLSLSKNIIPTMTFLEGLGVDKTQWPKVIHRAPVLLNYSRQKTQSTVDFLSEMGIAKQNIGKIITRCPCIMGYSVEDKLRSNADYFRSLGIDVASLFSSCPQAFGLGIESNLKPVTEFFLNKGFSIEDFGTMIFRYGPLYALGLVQSLIPKWEFFLTMGYPKSDLVKFPQYFSYSLEERIKPRYAALKKSGAKMGLSTLLVSTSPVFDKALKNKIAKMRLINDASKKMTISN